MLSNKEAYACAKWLLRHGYEPKNIHDMRNCIIAWRVELGMWFEASSNDECCLVDNYMCSIGDSLYGRGTCRHVCDSTPKIGTSAQIGATDCHPTPAPPA